MLTTGFMIFLGGTLCWPAPRRIMLRALHHDVALDLLVTVLVLAIHWGTSSGVMATVHRRTTDERGNQRHEETGGLHRRRSVLPGLINLKL